MSSAILNLTLKDAFTLGSLNYLSDGVFFFVKSRLLVKFFFIELNSIKDIVARTTNFYFIVK